MPTCDGVNDIVRLVASISDDPSVLVDLNGPALFYSDWQAPPPDNDGPIYLASSHEGRTIDFDINVQPQANADDVAAVLQPLQRLISRGNVWLQFQKAGAAKPVFFKLRRSDVTSITEWFAYPRSRTIHLRLNADPFSYGLKVEDSFTITNDPSASPANNPMMGTFPAIEGDVLTPLVLSFPTDSLMHTVRWASAAYLRTNEGGPTAPLAPPHKSLAAPTIDGTPPTGWTFSNVAAAPAIGGQERLVTRSGGTTNFAFPTASELESWTDLDPMDYRVLLRARGADENTRLMFFNDPQISYDPQPLTESDAATWAVVGQTPASSGHRDWFDLGVTQLPGGGPITDSMFDAVSVQRSALWNVGVFSELNFSLALDEIMLWPAGSPDVLTRHGYVEFPADWDDLVVTLDGTTGQRSARGEWSGNPGTTVDVPAYNMAGALPVVVPNADNRLFFLTTGATFSAPRSSDDKNATTLVSWAYYPRYLNDRAEAS